MDLLIDKKYLIRLECYTRFGWGGSVYPYAVRYVFRLPDHAGVPDGYTIYIEADYNSASNVIWENNNIHTKHPIGTKELENGKTYRIDRPSDTKYVATMTEKRENGKRYKRYTYTAEQLYELYQNVNLATAEIAVAKIDIYFEGREGARHKALYGNRIDKTVYLVGKVQGCWFYCSKLDTKRRIGSHGVTILGRIAVANELTAWEIIKNIERKIERCKKEFLLISSSRRDVENALHSIDHHGVEVRRTEDKDISKAVANILCEAQSALRLIDEKLSEEDAALEKIDEELKKQLSALYVAN